MPAVDILRRAPFLARLMLAWFALTLCVGVAASVRDPQALAGICSVGDRSGNPASDGDAGGRLADHGAHCLLCVSPAMPPSAPPLLVPPAGLGESPPRWVVSAAPTLRSFGPPAARAPPVRS